MNKIDQFKWTKPGDSGKQCTIRVDELLIDHSYQRREVGDGNTLSIARDLNWVAFNSLVVMQREDGKKYVVDGQQRLAAVKRRGDIKAVPCILFESDGPEHEAKAFLSLNVHRVKVSAVAKFDAAVMASEEPEKTISEWLASNGLRVNPDGKNKNGVCFPARLIRTWNINVKACKEAILLQREIDSDEPLHSDIHDGLFWLVNKGINVSEYVNKIKTMGGKIAMLQKIKKVQIETGCRSNRTAGAGVLELINHKLKGRKIALPDGE
jgi:hypothetical protein